MGTAIHLWHRHVRRNLYLTAHPGSIASIIALTSHSGFGELLYPYDDKAAMRRKLANLRFSLDKRTGAIIADEYGYLGDEDNMDEKVEMEMGRASARSQASSAPMVSSLPPDFPYEHEPLVVAGSRTSSRSRSPEQRISVP